jgi:GntR family transcriptional regulator / MocR family aminotransferase
MRVLHYERQHQLIQETERLGDRLALRPSDSGLHLVGRLVTGRDDTAVANDALRHGVHVWPLSIHHYNPTHAAGLLLGYAGTTAHDMRCGVDILDKTLKDR